MPPPHCPCPYIHMTCIWFPLNNDNKFLSNPFDIYAHDLGSQLQFQNFCSSGVMPLFTFVEKRGICVLWTQSSICWFTNDQENVYFCLHICRDIRKLVFFTENKQELKKPEFLKEIQDIDATEGQSVKFRCKVKGYPQPRICWYKDGKLLANDDCYKIGET